MTVDMAERIVALATQHAEIPFPLMLSALEAEGFDTKGDYEMMLVPGVLIWAGMSKAAVKAVQKAKTSRTAHLSPLPQLQALLVYSWEGAPFLALPYAVNPPAAGYKRPHWVATMWHPGFGPCERCIQ